MNHKFAAFIISRRSIAVGIFSGEKLESWEVRSFQADMSKAKIAVGAFVSRILGNFKIEAAALENLPEGLETRMAALTALTENVLREHGIPVLKAREIELLAAYGEPHLRSRAELRKVSAGIFPQLKNPSASKELLDAAILGLHIQTERMLSKLEEGEDPKEILA